jgi:hypothetical protein
MTMAPYTGPGPSNRPGKSSLPTIRQHMLQRLRDDTGTGSNSQAPRKTTTKHAQSTQRGARGRKMNRRLRAGERRPHRYRLGSK